MSMLRLQVSTDDLHMFLFSMGDVIRQCNVAIIYYGAYIWHQYQWEHTQKTDFEVARNTSGN